MNEPNKTGGEKLWTGSFILVILVNFFVFINHLMVLSAFPFYISRLGGSAALAGLAATLFSLVAVVCRPFIGWLLDGGKRRLILGTGLAGMLLAPLGYLAFPLLGAALALRMVHGVSLACSNTTASTLATDVIPKSRFAEGMGMFGMATALATACGPALGLKLMDFGFPTLFLAASGVAAAAMALFLLLKTPKVDGVRTPITLRSLVDGDALPASVIMLVFMLTFGALENFLAKFASENGLPGGGAFFAVMAVMLLLVRVTLGKLADRKGEGVFVYTCNAAMLCAFLLLAFVPGKGAYFLAAALAGYGFGGLEPALQSMAVHIAPPERRGAANSTFLCAYDIGIGLGGGAAGVLITLWGYSAMFAILPAANIASVLLYFFWGSRHPSSLRPKAGRA